MRAPKRRVREGIERRRSGEDTVSEDSGGRGDLLRCLGVVKEGYEVRVVDGRGLDGGCGG